MAAELQLLRRIREQDKEATVYVGNLDERVRDELVWELMIQVGRVVNVHLPKDRVSQTHQGYGFVEFQNPDEAVYASTVMNGIRLYGKPIRVNKATADKNKTIDIGAELFIGNLDPMVDERTLYETFSRFGTLVSPPKARGPIPHCSIVWVKLTFKRSLVTTPICPKVMVSSRTLPSKPQMLQLLACTDNSS